MDHEIVRNLIYRGKVYHLTDGVAIGSPILSVMANLFMEHLESNALTTATKKGISPQTWLSYVDAVFSLIKRVLMDGFCNIWMNKIRTFNSLNIGKKTGTCLFLRLLFAEKSDNLQTSMYQKPTSTVRVLSFNSQHPVSAKRAAVIAFLTNWTLITGRKTRMDRTRRLVTCMQC